MPSMPSTYAWFADDELLVMMNRYVDRAPSAELASTRLKVWLAQQSLSQSVSQTAVKAAPAPAEKPVVEGKKAPREAKRILPSKPAPRPTTPLGVEDPITGRVKLTRAQAAEYLGLSKSTLSNWAHLRTGPSYYKVGGVHYYQDELDAWRDRPAFDGD